MTFDEQVKPLICNTTNFEILQKLSEIRCHEIAIDKLKGMAAAAEELADEYYKEADNYLKRRDAYLEAAIVLKADETKDA